MSMSLGQAAGTAVAKVAEDAAGAALMHVKSSAIGAANSIAGRRGFRTFSEALALAGRALGFSLAAITTLSAGYLAGIGLEFIPLVDKYTIISSILLYASIAAALVSPLLVVPRTALAVHVKRREALTERLNDFEVQISKIERRREKNRDEARTIKERLRADKSTIHDRKWGDLRSLIRRTERTPRTQDVIVRDRDEKDRLQREIDSDDAEALGIRKKERQTLELQTQLSSGPWASRLRALCYALYAVVGAALFLSVLPTFAAAYFTLAMIALYALARRVSFDVAAPLVSVHLLALGILLGLESYNLPANAILRIGNDDHEVRVLATTSTGYIAIAALAKTSNERRLSFLPRETVNSVSALRPPHLAALYEQIRSFRIRELAGPTSR